MKYYEVIFRIDAPEELMQTGRDILSAMAGEAGFESFDDTADGLTGYVQQPLFARDVLDGLLAAFPLPSCAITYNVREAEYRDWNEQWEQQGFDPICLPVPEGKGGGEVVIHDGRHLPPPASLPAIVHAIEIDACQAFGTGTHETTRMMVSTLLDLPLEGLRVLDCGTGTGILSIAALKMGAREAVGYDIDEWSVDNARHNAVINRVDDRFTSLLGDASILAATPAATPADAAYAALDGLFDLVLANIHRNIILADMPLMLSKMKPGAHLAVSGFLTTDADMLLEKAARLGLSLVGSRDDSGWVCLLFRLV